MPALILLMWMPSTPPPSKPAEALPLAVVRAASPVDLTFIDIQIVDPRRMRPVKVRNIGGIPLVLGITDLK